MIVFAQGQPAWLEPTGQIFPSGYHLSSSEIAPWIVGIEYAPISLTLRCSAAISVSPFWVLYFRTSDCPVLKNSGKFEKGNTNKGIFSCVKIEKFYIQFRLYISVKTENGPVNRSSENFLSLQKCTALRSLKRENFWYPAGQKFHLCSIFFLR